MKNEHELNSYLAKEFRRHIPDVHVYKVADKYSVVPDFIIWSCGTSIGAEVKFAKSLPLKPGSKVLTHPFTPAQLAFMDSLEKTYNYCYGIIGLDDSRILYVIRSKAIPPCGNFTKEELQALPLTGKCIMFEYGDTDELLRYMFTDHAEEVYEPRH